MTPPLPRTLRWRVCLTNLGAIYDPIKQTFKPVKHPPHWQNIGDSGSVVLADGRYFLADKLHKRGAFLDPTTMTWSDAGYTGKHDFNSEEGLTLMPDGTVFTVDVKANPKSESYCRICRRQSCARPTSGRTRHSPSCS